MEKKQIRYKLPLKLISDIKKVTRILGFQYPAHYVEEVMSEHVKKILGNGNPHYERLYEIEREIGKISKEVGDTVYAATGGEKLEKWEKSIDKAVEKDIIEPQKAKRLKKRVRKKVKQVQTLQEEREEILQDLQESKFEKGKKMKYFFECEECGKKIIKKSTLNLSILNIPCPECEENMIFVKRKRIKK